MTVETAGPYGADATTPPPGCSVVDTGQDIIVRASARSPGTATTLLCHALGWNVMVATFVWFAFVSLYTRIVGPLPAWFPAPNMSGMSLGMAVAMCLFVIPFLVVGIGLLWILLVSLFGDVRVTLRGPEGTVSFGLGPLAWRRRFDAAAVRRISIGQTTWHYNDRHLPVVRIEADRTVQFGALLTDARRLWMYEVLRNLVIH